MCKRHENDETLGGKMAHLEGVINFFFGHVSAGEVHACLETEVLMGGFDEFGCEVRG